MDDLNEFNRLISRMTESEPPVKQQTPLTSIFGVIMAASIISGIGGLMLMLINMILISAFPDLTLINPGLGFFDGYKLFLMILILKMIFIALNNVQNKS